MRMRPLGRRLGLLAGAVLTIQWSLTAQPPSSATPSTKRPITYDVMDSWRSIQGPRLSRDGQSLAYALTAQGDDGELVVRSLGGGQEFRAPRGTNPSFTPDGRFVVFSSSVPSGCFVTAACSAEPQSGVMSSSKTTVFAIGHSSCPMT